jgi:6-phospho-beta-glucosidase
MKIGIVGGAGVRTPLLVSGLTASDLPIDEIALYDLDDDRLTVIADIAGRMLEQIGARARITRSRSVADCAASADFVFTSIRAGGMARRIADEKTTQRHGIVGQETVGPAGFAMAMRNIPPMVRCARDIAAAAPRAWIVNFTNPVGMVTEAMRTVTDRVIGICDTPTELFESAAHALGLDPRGCYFDYFGLNHLGWLREIYVGGNPQLHQLWRDADRLQAIYKVPLFDTAALRQLQLLPTEYVYYYDQPARAFDNVRRAARTRGQVIEGLTTALFETLRGSAADPVERYRAYLAARSAGYMALESGSAPMAHAPRQPQMSGYDKIALDVIRAIHANANDIIPLSVVNRGTMSDLRDSDVVEVPCVVNANGARPLHVGAVPARVLALLQQVKDYERRTIAAALAPSLDAARTALAANPLVPTRAAADSLVDDLMPLW